MIKVIYGPKGTGKTKMLVDTANRMSREAKGTVVFIDDSTKLMYDLSHRIRFVNVSEYPPLDHESFFGFICGVLSQDYDIEGIFIDRINFITKENIEEFETFFEKLKALAEKNRTLFFITLNGPADKMPDFLKQYAE
jgi:thymidine kinase